MTNKTSILIIDDNIDDRELCKRALKNTLQGALEFSEASSGETALETIAKEAPACVLLDYSLPRHNGIEVLKRLRERYPFVPVVMMTGQGNEAVAVTAMQQGAQNYIAKTTISPETLERVICAAIDHCALEKRIYEQRTALEVFTRALAHDLREPVRTVGSFVDLMEQHKDSPEKMESYFSHVRAAADRMNMLIDTVFAYVQLDSIDQMQRETCSMEQALMETTENLGQLMKECGTTVTYDPLPEITVNHTQMIQLLQNLITNAIRHSAKPVTVHVSAKEYAEHWLFSIHDNGPGIPPEFLAKIFEPFKRLSGKDNKSVGLGLAICRKIMEIHGGKIWCESIIGAGTTFFFSLPKKTAQPKPEASEVPHQAVGKATGELANVLLVDDRPSDIELTKIMLTDDAGVQCKLQIANDAGEALDVLRTSIAKGEIVDLMLLDINMPGMDGFELLEYMQKEEALKNVAVIMCTGSTYEKDKARAESLGAIGYLVKPPWFDKLKPIIEHVPGLSLQKEGEGYQLLRLSPRKNVA